MNEIDMHVGETGQDMGKRFVDAWKRAEQGLEVHERHLTFENMDGLSRMLTPKRVEMVRAVRSQPFASVRELAKHLHRDIKNVHGDLKALREAGVIDQDEQGVHTDVTHIRTTIAL